MAAKRSKRRRKSGKARGRGRRKSTRKNSRRRKSRGSRRRGRRPSLGTVTITKKARRSRRRKFRIQNPHPGLSRALAPKRRRGTSDVIRKKKKRRHFPSHGARDRRRWAKGRHGPRRIKLKSERVRSRPYGGRVAHVKLYRGYRMAPWKRKRLARGGYLSRQGLVNPGRRRRRRNPDGILNRVRDYFTSPQTYVQAGHGLLGVSAATVGPALIESASKGKIRNENQLGIALSAASTGIAYGAAYWVESYLSGGGEPPVYAKHLARNVGFGGMLVVGLRAAFQFLPQLAEMLKLTPPRVPIIPLGAPPAVHPAVAAAMAKGARGMGASAAQFLNANEALVAGESRARQLNQLAGMGDMGDWLELKGMGDWLELRGMGGARVPYQDVRSPFAPALAGYSGQYGAGGYNPYLRGMGDWITGIQADQGAATGAFDPGMETF